MAKALSYRDGDNVATITTTDNASAAQLTVQDMSFDPDLAVSIDFGADDVHELAEFWSALSEQIRAEDAE